MIIDLILETSLLSKYQLGLYGKHRTCTTPHEHQSNLTNSYDTGLTGFKKM